jgi:hypothetical protein
LWHCDILKSILQDKVKYSLQLPSNSEYYFRNAKRFAEDGFRPTTQDQFMVKMMTTGVHELSWEEDGNEITVVDVGGTLPARRKWSQVPTFLL